ncbi:MAG: tyrosine-type recombinase/integrase, partial [Oribacterium sp.]|nr:tyrosine-type recombinase/integrase [Oribacterium sp.]
MIGLYTDNVHLDNYRSPLTEGEIEMDDKATVMEFIELWLDTFKKNSVKTATLTRLQTSKNTLANYEIASKKIGELNFFDIQRYVNQLVEDGYSLSNIKKQLRIVTSPLKLAAAMKIIPADPSIGVRLPNETKVKKQTKEVIAYTNDEQEKLFKRVAVSPLNVGCMGILFMIETGLRSGELLALKWKDVELDRSRMHVHATILNPMSNVNAIYQDSPKTKSSKRIVPLTPKAKAILKRLMEERTTEWVFE